MEKQITYKKQGDGRDSWRIDEIENGKILSSYMVYENPNADIDLSKLTAEQIQKLKEILSLI